MVYGNFEGESVTEETPCNPIGIYGALKLSGELIVKAYHQVFGLNYTIVRPSALYGPRCVSRRVGQIFIENALRGQDIIIKGDGKECLDFTYIADLVAGIKCCIERPEARNQTFNLTFGHGRSINEMASILKQQFPKINIRHEDRDTLIPERGTLCIEKAKRLLGYQTLFPLEKGYCEYIKWYRSFFDEVNPSPASICPQVNE
jgi:nucleoside-diphosphate-sugar epimerase